MKNILYKILPVCLLTIGLTGCEDETKYRPLPEAVPLTMSINEKAFVMGEHLKVDIKVEPDADGNEVLTKISIFTLRQRPERMMLRMYSNRSAVLSLFPKERSRFRWISR